MITNQGHPMTAISEWHTTDRYVLDTAWKHSWHRFILLEASFDPARSDRCGPSASSPWFPGVAVVAARGRRESPRFLP
jgi:hypothetical protein